MPDPVDESRSGPAGEQRRPKAVPILALCRWLGPHAVIWLVAGAYVLTSLRAPQCSGSCGLVRGVVDYFLLAVAVTLSAAVGVVQFVVHALLSRPPLAFESGRSGGLYPGRRRTARQLTERGS